MDIGSAFTYMFDDEDWIKKLAIGGVAWLLGIVIVPFFLLFGYMLQTLKNVRDGQPVPLPEWDDFGTLIVEGLKVFAIALIYSIPALIFYCASFGVQIGMQQADPDISNVLTGVAACVVCFEIVFLLLAVALFPAGMIRYAQYDTLSAAFQFGEIFRFISANIGNYIIVVLLTMVAQFISIFGILLCCIGIYVTSFWSMLVSANLYGQLAKEAS
jgi:hypothetical protein